MELTELTGPLQGKTLRVIRNPYIEDWERNRAQEARKLLNEGIIPAQADINAKMSRLELDPQTFKQSQALLMGQVAAVIDTIEPAGKIINDMVYEAVSQLRIVNEMAQTVPARL
jgi:NAD(P)H-dependent flavin oxidoreductase YrpB (nitropropane dioxygenase family)